MKIFFIFALAFISYATATSSDGTTLGSTDGEASKLECITALRTMMSELNSTCTQPSCACLKRYGEEIVKIKTAKTCAKQLHYFDTLTPALLFEARRGKCDAEFKQLKETVRASARRTCSAADWKKVIGSKADSLEAISSLISQDCVACVTKNSNDDGRMENCMPQWAGETCSDADQMLFMRSQQSGDDIMGLMSPGCFKCISAFKSDDKDSDEDGAPKGGEGPSLGGDLSISVMRLANEIKGDILNGNLTGLGDLSISGDLSDLDDLSDFGDLSDLGDFTGGSQPPPLGGGDTSLGGQEPTTVDGGLRRRFLAEEEGKTLASTDEDEEEDDGGFIFQRCFTTDGVNPREKIRDAMKACGVSTAGDGDMTDAQAKTLCKKFLNEKACQDSVVKAGVMAAQSFKEGCSDFFDFDALETPCPKMYAVLKANNFCEDDKCDKFSDTDKNSICGDFGGVKVCNDHITKVGKMKQLMEVCGGGEDEIKACVQKNKGKGAAQKCLGGVQLSRKDKAKLERMIDKEEAEALLKDMNSACTGDKRKCIEDSVKDMPAAKKQQLKKGLAKEEAKGKLESCTKTPAECLDEAASALSEFVSKKATKEDRKNAVKFAVASGARDELQDCMSGAQNDLEKKLCRQESIAKIAESGVVPAVEAKIFIMRSMKDACADAYASCKDDEGTDDDCIAVAKESFNGMGGNEARWAKIVASVLRKYNLLKSGKETVIRKLDGVDITLEVSPITKAGFTAKAKDVIAKMEAAGKNGTCTTKLTQTSTIEIDDTSLEIDFEATCEGDCCAKVNDALAGKAGDAAIESLNMRRVLRRLLEEEIGVGTSVSQQTAEVAADDLNEDGSIPEDFNPDAVSGTGEDGGIPDPTTTTTGSKSLFSGAETVAVSLVAGLAFLF